MTKLWHILQIIRYGSSDYWKQEKIIPIKCFDRQYLCSCSSTHWLVETIHLSVKSGPIHMMFIFSFACVCVWIDRFLKKINQTSRFVEI